MRRLRLRFHATPGPAIGEALAALSPQPELRHDGLALTIDYPFPDLSLVEIWQALKDNGSAGHIDAGSRLRCRTGAFLERNECERQQAPRGWRHQAREIHAQYFEQRHGPGGDQRRQQWRKLAYTQNK